MNIIGSNIYLWWGDDIDAVNCRWVLESDYCSEDDDDWDGDDDVNTVDCRWMKESDCSSAEADKTIIIGMMMIMIIKMMVST